MDTKPQASSKSLPSTKEHRKEDSQGSLPDQLPIQSQSSSSASGTSVRDLKPLKSKIHLKKSRTKSLKQILKPKTPVTKKYFTAAEGVDSSIAIDVSKDPSPFEYPKDLEVFAHKVMTKAWRNEVRLKELKVKCSQKPSFKDRQKNNLLKRLYVEEPKVETMKTILEIDPQYFKVVEGRPIPDRLDIRKYIDTVRDSLRTKIITGYREDDIMLIEENSLLEQKIIDSIRENYNKYVNVFEEFLYRDHTSSMQLLKESEQAAREAYEKYEEYKAVAKKYNALKSALYNSEEKWRNCLMYEKFLYLVSPFGWRNERKAKFQKFCDDDSEETDAEENVFNKYRLSNAGEEMSLTDLIKRFNTESGENEEPEIYFTSPEQLLDVFRYMESQNLNSLLHSEELAVPLDQVREGMKHAEEMFDEEINNLQEIIDKLEGGISWEEERARYLEELALKLIGDEFKRLIMDDEVLNLHVFVEDVYETRIGPNDANLSMADMMKSIEAKYRNELLSLDKVPAEQVALLEGTCYREQAMMMKYAEQAARQYAELEQLTYRLNKALAPAYVKTGGKEPKKRSPPIHQRPPQPPPPRDLTPGEAEYLDFFTDYCRYTDDPKDYGIDVTHEVEAQVEEKESTTEENVDVPNEDKIDQENKE